MKPDWDNLIHKSKSKDRFERISALAISVTMIEIALIACDAGLEKDPLWTKLDTAYKERLISERDKNLAKDASKWRNKGVHSAIPPSPRECEECVEDLFAIWKRLRSQFVSKERAAHIAQGLLRHGDIVDVYLFGSLARRRRGEVGNDIDLFLLDNGQLSSQSFGYHIDPSVETAEWILEQTRQDSIPNRAAVRCGWLDLVVFDETCFDEKDYISNVSRAHKDRLFLLNIADGILFYNKKDDEWQNPNNVEKPTKVDRKLIEFANLRKELRRLGIVRGQW